VEKHRKDLKIIGVAFARSCNLQGFAKLENFPRAFNLQVLAGNCKGFLSATHPWTNNATVPLIGLGSHRHTCITLQLAKHCKALQVIGSIAPPWYLEGLARPGKS
jgi:hypothetical protein